MKTNVRKMLLVFVLALVTVFTFAGAGSAENEPEIPALETVETEYAARALTAALNTFLDGCGEEDRFLFVRRYWFADSVSHLAGVLHCTPHRVSVRLFRLRKRLQSYLEKEGISV